jgi:predicted aminopeptidase
MLCFAAMRRRVIGLTAVVAILSACSTLSYYAQSVGGQLRLLAHRQPIEQLLSDGALDPELKQRLQRARSIRNFASAELDLPDNGSYRSYVQLDQPYVVWSVFATPRFSLRPRQWCFPIAGCVPYRGYFAQAAAEAFAADLRKKDLDVYVGGVPAYSTLGWFNDPLLSSMLMQGETGTASIIFHELAHQQVYVQGDTAFNEAFAVAVEKAGVRRWLSANDRGAQLAAYDAAWRRRQQFYDLVEKTRARLSSVYRSDMAPARMREAKRRILTWMRKAYACLKRRWNGFDGYDYWFEAPINNAKLAAVAIYRELVPDFERLLDACDNDFARFFEAAAELEDLQPSARRRQLRRVQGCA